MIDIIGNIVITNPIRQKYFNATLQSLGNLEGCFNLININIGSKEPHGEAMLRLISKSKNDYFLNFEEDHFCVLEDAETFKKIIETIKLHNVDAMRTSFHLIEMKSAKYIRDIIYEDDIVKIFKMNKRNYINFQIPFERYYIGTNNIFKCEFAKQIFERKGYRPHDFEIRQYQYDFEYICAVPKIEILRPIDDDHGIDNTCMIKNPTEYFLELMKK